MTRSSFASLNIASTGLSMAQRQLDVTSHNISNTNVTGYSRQRYVSSAMPALGWTTQFTSPIRGKAGNGVESLSLDQIRDIFLDRQFRNEQTKTSYWQARSQALYYIEDVFNATGPSSLDGVLSSFFNSIQELSKNSTDEAVRTNVVANAKKFVEILRLYDGQLTDLMEQQNFNLVEKTKHTNNLLVQLAALNDNIFRFELGGSTANDLRDKRALLLDELSGLLDITYTEMEFDPPMYNIYGIELAQMVVYAGSRPDEDSLLVQHKEAFPLVLEEMGEGNEIFDALMDEGVEFDPPFMNVFLSYGVDGFEGEHNGIQLVRDGEVEGYNGGLLQSYIDVRDGDDVDLMGIPYYLMELNRLVSTLVEVFNEYHENGWSMPYSNSNGSSASESGISFFDGSGLTARTIALDEKILESAFNIAASSQPVLMEPDGMHSQTGNNENVLEILKRVFESTELPVIGSVEGFYKNFLGIVASEASAASGMTAAQEVLLTSIQNQREAVSGVSEDEEMTNLIRFQHAYNASARCITTIDDMLDKLINGTGRVGL